MAESRHVFIDGNDLATRFSKPNLRTFTIGECGFGFGLNFLLTCRVFSEFAPPGAQLHFISTELHPVSPEDFRRYYQSGATALLPLANTLLQVYAGHTRGQHRYSLEFNDRLVILDLCLGDALEAFDSLCLPEPIIDAWFLDGFAPAKNQALWQSTLFDSMATLSSPGATLATYTVAGDVRRQLQSAGFQINKAPGYGKKRHMLTGYLPSTFAKPSPKAGWSYPYTDTDSTITHVGVIGAGLAGCATAYALARRGLNVTLVEKSDKVASGASGNPRGIVHFNPGLQADPGNRFRLACYLYALRHYDQLQQTHDIGWQASGLLQLIQEEDERHDLQRLLDNTLFEDEVLARQEIDKSTLKLSGIDTTALCFPGAGSLDPGALCQAWSSHKNINFRGHHEAIALHQDSNWQITLRSDQDESVLHVDAVVVCNSHEASSLSGIPEYPLTMNHGQTDTFRLDQNTDIPPRILRHKGYLIPWTEKTEQFVTIGGQMCREKADLNNPENLLTANLALISQFSPELGEELKNRQLHLLSRGGTRTGSPDYFPLAGSVEDRGACTHIYAGLGRNARQEIASRPAYQRGLFVNLAHGANGLTTTPLLGDYIASLIMREVSPLSEELTAVVSPLRYLIRGLKKQQL